MFQSYHFKWYFVLTGILAATTLLMKLGEPRGLTIGQSLGHVLSIVVYISSVWFIHGYFRQAKRIKTNYGARTAIGIIVGTLFLLVLNYAKASYVPESIIFPETLGRSPATDFLRRLTESVLLCMIAFVVYNNVEIDSKFQQSKLENEKLKQADLRAHLNSLQKQISPHFLFNSLSTLKTIATDRDTKDFVIQLSKVYRYLLNFNEHHVAKLSEELKFIEAYLYIMHKRLGDALKVDIAIPNQYNDYLIPPLSVQLLIENALKHNALSPETPLTIKIFISDRGELVISNSIRTKKMPEEGTKFGLKNISERFELLFDKKVTFCHTVSDFTVTLPIVSYEYYHH